MAVWGPRALDWSDHRGSARGIANLAGPGGAALHEQTDQQLGARTTCRGTSRRGAGNQRIRRSEPEEAGDPPLARYCAGGGPVPVLAEASGSGGLGPRLTVVVAVAAS